MIARAEILVQRGSSRRAAGALHRRIAGEADLVCRMRTLAEALCGCPYVCAPLVGGADEPEQLVVDLHGFDCVTFVESVLALARSRSWRGFVDELRCLRYHNGVVDWRARLHYFSDWMAANHRRKVIRNRTRGSGSRAIETVLGAIATLPARRARLQVVPKRELRHALARIADGSVIAFATVRAKLDFFHTGLVFRDSEGSGNAHDLMLYHASRSARAVVRMPLGTFLQHNRMRGIAFAAPVGGE